MWRVKVIRAQKETSTIAYQYISHSPLVSCCAGTGSIYVEPSIYEQAVKKNNILISSLLLFSIETKEMF